MITSGQLHPPFLELAFYLGPGDHRLAVSSALVALEEHGAEVSSDVWTLNDAGALEGRKVRPDQLPEVKGLDDQYAIEVCGVPGLASVAEVLECERMHVLLRTEAGPLSEPRPSKSEKEVAGLKTYHAFKLLAQSLDAAYGAICIEYSLESPQELREDARSLAFRNFWVSHRRVPQGARHRIERIMSGGYVEQWWQGTYFSTDPAYNPQRIGLSTVAAQELSADVARVLSKALIA